MSPADLCVCTISLARDEREAALIRHGLQQLSAANLPVIVADGGSPPPLVDFIRALPGVRVVTPRQRGLVPQIKAALPEAAALGTRFILYAESDKALFFETHLADFIARAPDDDRVGVVLASRTSASFATFPALQRSNETIINEMNGDAVEQPGDYSYGPFLLNRALVPHVMTAPDGLGWGWRHFAFGLAHRLACRVVHVTGDYECPPDQRVEDESERAHRMRQLAQNIEGLQLSMTMPL